MCTYAQFLKHELKQKLKHKQIMTSQKGSGVRWRGATVSSRVDRERGNPSSRSLREEPTYTVAYQAAFLLLVEFLVRDEQAAGALEVFCCPACLVRWLSSRGGLSASGEAWSPA